MANGEKWILEQWADAFDRMHHENMQFFDEGTRMHIHDTATQFGVDNWRTDFAAVHGGLTYAFLEFSQSFVGGLLDILRLGESIRKPSVGAVVQDGLRLVTIAAPAIGMLQFVKLKAAFAVPGAAYSCALTSSTMALRLSGTRMFARIGDVLKGMKEVSGNLLTEEIVLANNYGGTSPENLTILFQNLARLGLKMRPVRGTVIASDVGAVVAKTGQPVLFNVQSTPSRHMMLAYKDLKGVIRLADQSGHAHEFYNYASNFGMTVDVFLLENVTILHPYVSEMLAASAALQNGNRLPFWANLIGVPVTVVDQSFINSVEIKVRQRLNQMKATAAPSSVRAMSPLGQKPKLVTTDGLKRSVSSMQINSDVLPFQTTTYNYRVKIGDTLFGLAKRFYSDAAKYNWIQNSNTNYLPALKPDQQLPIGAEIVIPGN